MKQMICASQDGLERSHTRSVGVASSIGGRGEAAIADR